MTDSNKDRREGLENTAQVLTNRGLYRSAAMIYSKAVTQDPDHGMTWTGLAESLFRLSAEERDVELLELSLRCVRRCLQGDKDNFWANRLERSIEACSMLPQECFATCAPLEGDDPTSLISARLGLSAGRLAEDLEQVSWEERMLIVMWIAEQRDPDFVELLIRASRDDNKQVQLVAVQPLSLWASRQEVRSCFEALVQSRPEQEVATDLKKALTGINQQFPEHAAWATSLTDALAG